MRVVRSSALGNATVACTRSKRNNLEYSMSTARSVYRRMHYSRGVTGLPSSFRELAGLSPLPLLSHGPTYPVSITSSLAATTPMQSSWPCGESISKISLGMVFLVGGDPHHEALNSMLGMALMASVRFGVPPVAAIGQRGGNRTQVYTRMRKLE